ncbi:hypothetical protein [Haloferula rosea]|uniref:Uncharacterized protein n=1 Tax=Haloferula rosea TaxID=490093 RepID=A0A934VDI9_9BACT|nr:hypothetical protein [Haloferula rosea]MBK1826324.1 hypothetical protein [Haloferula rosea]
MIGSSHSLNMSVPAIYRITVQGKLDEKLVRHLDGLNLSEITANGETPVGVLVGRLIDQAALSGLLNSLYDLQLPIISVECINVEAADAESHSVPSKNAELAPS